MSIHRTFGWPPWARWPAALVVLSGTACAQILGLEEWKPQGSSSGNGGGPGTSSSSAGGGASSSSGAGGGCACPPDPECGKYSCMNNQCMLTNTQQGLPSSMQTARDCQTRVCDGNGGATLKEDPTDLPASVPCQDGVCLKGMPAYSFSTPGTMCDVNSTCSGAGVCELCMGPVSSCADKCVSVGETDTDCGGGCPLCGPGKHCFVNTDCQSGQCQSNQTCL